MGGWEFWLGTERDVTESGIVVNPLFRSGFLCAHPLCQYVTSSGFQKLGRGDFCHLREQKVQHKKKNTMSIMRCWVHSKSRRIQGVLQFLCLEEGCGFSRKPQSCYCLIPTSFFSTQTLKAVKSPVSVSFCWPPFFWCSLFFTPLVNWLLWFQLLHFNQSPTINHQKLSDKKY